MLFRLRISNTSFFLLATYTLGKVSNIERSVIMQQFIVLFMDQFGYLGILFLIMIENLFPPIPSEVILAFGGFMTTYSNMNVLGVVLFSTLGSLS